MPVNVGPEPLSACQWDMRAIHATSAESYAVNQGRGARIGDIDTGIDLTNSDIMPNVDVAASCVFLYADTPTANPAEQVTRGDCSNKAALQDLAGHGTHTAGTIAAPINGVGVSGVAPQAKVVVLKAGTEQGYFFTQSVVDALRYAGDQHLDAVNMSFFADPWLFNCRNDKEQKAIIQAISAAARYAQQRGVVLIAAAGNEGIDLNHPVTDEISPDFPPGAAVTRPVNNSCVVLPQEIARRRRRHRDRRAEPAVVVLDLRQPHRRHRAGWLALPDPDVRSDPWAGAVDVFLDRQRPRPRGRARAPRPGRQRQLLRLAERDVDGGAARRRCGGTHPGGPSGHVARCGRGAAAQHGDRSALPGRARSWRRVLRRPGAVLQGGSGNNNFYGKGLVNALAAASR